MGKIVRELPEREASQSGSQLEEVKGRQILDWTSLGDETQPRGFEGRRDVKGFGCGLLCELCVGIKGLMKCLPQARGDRHWGEGQESGCHRGAGIGEVSAAWPGRALHVGQTVII